MAKAYDYLFKLIIIGDSYVGKTSLLFRFCDSAFSITYISTIGMDYKIRTINLDGKRIKLQLWDTAGQERYTTMANDYYRRAMGVLFVYDITNEKSFDHIIKWIHNVEERADTGVERMLIGNKCDIRERKVPREKGEHLAHEYGLPFFETSAKGNINVEQAFEFIAKVLKDKHDAASGPLLPIRPPLPKPNPDNASRSWFWSLCSLI